MSGGTTLSGSPRELRTGEYTELVEIGRGASSVVYRATSPVFGRDVAIKLFHGTVDDPELRRRFVRECHTVGSLGDHPHVVSVFDNGFTRDRRPFLVMPYCSGGSFGQRLYGQGPRPLDEVLAVGIAVADALHEAHARGVVHRDVKPHNVLLTGYGVVALADFGVAVQGAPDSASLAATPGYAAPEVVVDAAAAGPAADVYALGATLFALITGGAPFRPGAEESELAFLLRTVEEPAPAVPRDVPIEIADVIEECLAKDAAHRPESVLVVRDELRRAATCLGLDLPDRLPLLPLPVPEISQRIPDLAALPATELDEPERPARERSGIPRPGAVTVAALATAGVAFAALIGSGVLGGTGGNGSAPAPRTSSQALPPSAEPRLGQAVTATAAPTTRSRAAAPAPARTGAAVTSAPAAPGTAPAVVRTALVTPPAPTAAPTTEPTTEPDPAPTSSSSTPPAKSKGKKPPTVPSADPSKNNAAKD